MLKPSLIPALPAGLAGTMKETGEHATPPPPTPSQAAPMLERESPERVC